MMTSRMSFGRSMSPSGAVMFHAFGPADGPLSNATSYGGAPPGAKWRITPRMSFGRSTEEVIVLSVGLDITKEENFIPRKEYEFD